MKRKIVCVMLSTSLMLAACGATGPAEKPSVTEKESTSAEVETTSGDHDSEITNPTLGAGDVEIGTVDELTGEDPNSEIMHPTLGVGDVMIGTVDELTGNSSEFDAGSGNMKVFQEYLKSGGNLLYSPYSLKSAFSIIYPGATGDSKAQIESVLRFNDSAVAFYDEYESKLTGDSPVRVANRAYINNGYVLHPEVLRVDNVKSMPFATPDDLTNVVNDANSFVSDNTNGKINKLLDASDVDATTGLIAINALYFNKDWEFKDDEDVNSDGYIYWHDSGDGYQSVKIESEKARYIHSIKSDAEYGVDITRLPYAQDGDEHQYSMYLITDDVSSDKQNVKDYMLSLDDVKLAEVTSGFENVLNDYTKVTIEFPKFEFESREQLGDTLVAAGLEAPFLTQRSDGTYNDDFKAIADPAENNGDVLVVDKVIQSTYIKVNEAGTEAAASTGIVMNFKATAMAPGDEITKTVLADDPFAYIIKDDTAGVVLFMGYVDDLSNIGIKE